MKKYLILLVTLLTNLIFCVSNVSASGIIEYNSEYITFNTENTQICNIFNYCGDYTINYSISDFENYNNVYLYINSSGLEIIMLFTENEITLTDNKISSGYGIITNGKYRTLSYSDWWNNPKYYQYRTTSGNSSTNLGVNYELCFPNIPTTISSNSFKYIGGTSDVYSQSGNLYIEKMDFSGPTEPQLQYKTGFTSSEAYNVLGKVSVEFLETDTNIYKYKKSQFKLQFGSNDFSKENIPIFSHYKVYGKRNDTWTELSEEDLKMPYDQDINGNIIYDDRNLITVDTTYDYSEGMLADASITLEINYDYLVDLDTTNPIWTDWKIEFYFDNTNNGYIYVYDTLAESTWNDTAKIFNDYLFYYFPPGYRYAFISSEETSSIGRIYFSSNHYVSQLVRLKGFYYHYSINWIADELVRNISEEDTYYSYFDFNFSYSDKRCVALSRKLGSLYTGYYDPNFLSNYLKPFPDEWLIFNSEISYFYAPIGMKVTFSKEMLDDIIIYTPDGTIKNDSSTIYDTTDYDIWDDYDNVDDMFSHLTNFFQESIPYMKPLIDLFVDFYNSLNEYVKAFIEFFAIFLLICAVILWLDRRSDS